MSFLECFYKKPIYQSPDYGVTIALYEEEGKPVTVTGKMLPTVKNIKIIFSGEWVTHPKYGMQFKAESFEEMIDSNEDAIISYLSSGLIKGIGKKTAQRIVDRFGITTLEVMDNHPEELLTIKGISKASLEKILSSYKESKASREVIMLLAKKGISPRLAQEAYIRFGYETMKIIKQKPYKLSLIKGIPFLTADAIKEEKDEEYCTSYERFTSCARYVLKMAEVNSIDIQAIIGSRTSGSTGMLKDDFGAVMLSLLKGPGVDGKLICERTIEMIKDKSVIYRKIDGNEVLFAPGVYNMEKAVSEDMARLCYSSVKPLDKLQEKIYKAEEALNINLSFTQINAVKMAFSNGLSIITGPPGSGKTTVFKVIAWIYEHYEKGDVLFLAPTGRAAARIQELGYQASTIHSALMIGADDIDDISKEETLFKGPMLIGVDEFSMADLRVSYKLLSSIGNGCRVILCGDPDQLPSVGAGAVLRDALSVKSIPATKLETVYRTSTKSNIFQNCNLIRQGNTDLKEGNGFVFLEEENLADIEDLMVLEYLSKIEKYGMENVMLLSPYKEHDGGVFSLNKRIQSILNPSNVNEKIFWFKNNEMYYRIGDPVLNLLNDKDLGITNGDIGFVKDISKNKEDEDVLIVSFQKKEIAFTRDQIQNLTLAYACTVHKSQGSEYKSVIFPAHSGFSLMYKRNLVYTALSRGKEEVTVIGSWDFLKKGILCEDKSKRITALSKLLQISFGEFTSMSFTA